MSANKTVARVGVLAFALGLVAGPQTMGLASADAPDAGSSSTTQSKGAAHRAARAAKADSAPASASRVARSAPSAAAAAAPSANRRAVAHAPADLPASVATAVTSNEPSAPVAHLEIATPAPTDTVSTTYGDLGKWMINGSGNIANWLGKKQPVNNTTGAGGPCPPSACTSKTILEGVNVVFVDTASSSPQQAVRNLNAWLRQSGFGASAISSTGYGGYFGFSPSLYSQQPTGANQAFRNSFFLFANSHARVFGPYATEGGYVWTSSASEENWSISNPLTHGYQSFATAQQLLTAGMINAGAQNLGTQNMDNQYITDTTSTGDASGYASVLGLNKVLKSASTARGAVKTTPGR